MDFDEGVEGLTAVEGGVCRREGGLEEEGGGVEVGASVPAAEEQRGHTQDHEEWQQEGGGEGGR